jgi:transcriptional regulator with XRE-family HTH domain
MAGHQKRVDHARWRAHAALVAVGQEIRQARLDHDLSQSVAARAAGTSRSSWSRLESGSAGAVTLVQLASALAVVGLDLHLRAIPGGQVLRDAAHVGLLERLRVRLGPGVIWRTEVPLPNPGDRRAWDAVIRVAAARIGVEAETRARDSQELERRLALKRRDGGVDHVVLLLANTRHNRRFLRDCGEGFHGAFPLQASAALSRLALGGDPGGSAIVLL